jgi:hypothetical protein
MVMTGVAGQHVLLVLETFFLEDLKQELLAPYRRRMGL